MSLLGNSNPGTYSSGQSAYLNLPLSLGYGQTGSLQMPMGNASGKPSYLQIPLSNGFGPSINIQIELGRPGDVSPSSVPPNTTSNPVAPTQFGTNNQPLDRFTSIIPKSAKDEYPTIVAPPPLVKERIQIASQPKLATKGVSHFVSIPSQTDLSIELPKDTGFSITSPEELEPIRQPDYPSTVKQDLVPWVVP